MKMCFVSIAMFFTLCLGPAQAGLKDGKHSVRPGETVLIYGAPASCDGTLPSKAAVEKAAIVSPAVGKILVGEAKGGTRLLHKCKKKVSVLPVQYTVPKGATGTIKIRWPGEKTIILTVEP